MSRAWSPLALPRGQRWVSPSRWCPQIGIWAYFFRSVAEPPKGSKSGSQRKGKLDFSKWAIVSKFYRGNRKFVDCYNAIKFLLCPLVAKNFFLWRPLQQIFFLPRCEHRNPPTTTTDYGSRQWKVVGNVKGSKKHSLWLRISTKMPGSNGKDRKILICLQ